MIFTSNYENVKNGVFLNLASISYDRGESTKFNGSVIEKLIPNDKLYSYYRSLSSQEDIEKFAEMYYLQILKQQQFILKRLARDYNNVYGHDIILLNHGLPNEFDYRFLVAAYLENKCGTDVPELFIDEEGNYMATTRKPNHSKEMVLRLVERYEK